MIKTINLIAILVALAFFPASVLVAGYGHGMFSRDIGDMDTNADQQITFDEFKNFQIKDLRAAFDMLDTNKDGIIDENEWNEFIRVHGGK